MQPCSSNQSSPMRLLLLTITLRSEKDKAERGPSKTIRKKPEYPRSPLSTLSLKNNTSSSGEGSTGLAAAGQPCSTHKQPPLHSCCHRTLHPLSRGRPSPTPSTGLHLVSPCTPHTGQALLVTWRVTRQNHHGLWDQLVSSAHHV